MRILPLTERKKVLSYVVKMIWTFPRFLVAIQSGGKGVYERFKTLLTHVKEVYKAAKWLKSVV